MENYEQKYKDGLSFLKDLKPHMSDYCKEKLEEFFPELRESEDERIRNFLIKQANSVLDSITDDDEEVPAWKSALAWLEKQGEQKPAWSEEDERMLGKCIDAASGYYSPEDKQSIKDWLESLKDRVQLQPKQEWSEKDKSFIEDITNVIIENYNILQSDKEKMINWLKSLKPQPKYQWTDEDEKNLKDLRLR